VELYLHSPNTPSWRGGQLNKSTGTTLLLPLPVLKNKAIKIKCNCPGKMNIVGSVSYSGINVNFKQVEFLVGGGDEKC
jgi:hypothetical protein